MKIDGVVTETKYMEVDVSERDIITAVIHIFDKKFAEYRKGDHIEDGVWRKFSGYNGHTGDEMYDRGENATEIELEIDHIRNTLYLLQFDSDKTKYNQLGK